MSRRWLWIVGGLLILAAAVMLYQRHAANRVLAANDAVTLGYVTIQVQAVPAGTDAAAISPVETPTTGGSPAPDGGDSGPAPASNATVVWITITLTKLAPGGGVTVTLPAGTLIANGHADGQRLMTAQTLTVHLTRAKGPARLLVETYCLDMLRLDPAVDTPLSFADAAPNPNPDDLEEDLDPAAKLVRCLAGGNLDYDARQNAVWVIRLGAQERPYLDARATLRQKFHDKEQAQMDARAGGGKAVFEEKIRDRRPGITPEEMAADLAEVTPEAITELLDAHADALAEKAAKGFLKARPALEACGYKTDSLAFFNSPVA